MARFVIGALLLLLGTSAGAQTNVTVGKMTVDGQEVRALKCSLKKGGFFALATVVGALSKQKQALDACVPRGAAFRMTWQWRGGKARDVKVVKASTKGKDPCVVAAVARTKAATDGTCQAIILVGASPAAGKAADALK